MKSLTQKLGIIGSIALMPALALAQFTEGNTGEIGGFGLDILNFINNVLVPFLFAVALALFIYGVFIYLIYSGGEEDSRDKGRKYMLWGIIAFVIMVSVWGITNLLAAGLGFSNQDSIDNYIPDAINVN